jgi:CHAD domain-containing protein
MPFHFKKAEAPARAVRRACRAHIGAALARLRKSRHPAAVHGARKEIKKLRAILQLVRGKTGRGAKALRRAARRLAAARDARATLKAFEKLPAAPERFPEIHAALQKNCRRETRRFRDKDSVARAQRILRKAGRCINNLKIKGAGWAAVEAGLRRTYRRGRQAGNLAGREPSPENLHAWRKQVKNLWCHLRLLCPEWPPAVRAMTGQIEQLGDQLGDDHDLFLLQQFVTDHCDGKIAEAKALNQLIASRRKKLRASALKLGDRLYARTPAAVCAQLQNAWNAWRSGAGRH